MNSSFPEFNLKACHRDVQRAAECVQSFRLEAILTRFRSEFDWQSCEKRRYFRKAMNESDEQIPRQKGTPEGRMSRGFFEDVVKTLLALRPKLYFDWLPKTENGRMTFLARLGYPDEKTAIDFQVDLNRLAPNENERLLAFIKRRQAGITTPSEMAFILAWLLDLSITQNSPNSTSEERQLELLRLLLIVPQEHRDTSNVLGVSPLLLFISNRSRNQLRKAGIAIEELERESLELSAGLAQFEKIPRDPDIPIITETYNRLIIAHLEKVRSAGDLLGGSVGKALIAQADLAIEWLHLPPERRLEIMRSYV
jgi:hypothetical protein